MKSLILKPGRERSVLRKHPWIFSGAVADVRGDPQVGDSIEIQTFEKKSIAIATFSPYSNIRARIWDWEVDHDLDKRLICKKIQNAIQCRQKMPLYRETNAIRLIFAESDGLPGLIVDQYADWLVLQFLSAGVEKRKEEIVENISEVTGCSNLFERSDVDVRKLEGLLPTVGVLKGKEPPEVIEIYEYDTKYLVNIRTGQKTGFYLDQRENRQIIRRYSKSKTVLNCFCYSGGFSLNAFLGGATEVISIDSSHEALELARRNVFLNSFNENKFSWMETDVFQQMRKYRDEGKKFDLIALDPPKFASTISQAPRAARGYKDINLLAFKLLNSEGILFTFSCSGGVSMNLFQKIVADAALDAGVNAQIIQKLHQASDHPVALNFPESEYLKGLVCHK